MAFSKAAFVFWMVAIVGVAVAAWLVFSRTESAHDRARGTDFVESATAAGLTWRMTFLNNEQGEHFTINLYDHGSGVAIGDFDGDGHDDIYLVNQLGRNALYRNRGDGTFVDVTEKGGVGLGDRICTMATFADYDNSGRQSLFVTSTRGGNVLFKNLGDGKFEDVTKKAGLTHVGHSQACVFFDYDNDGFLDLLVTNTAEWTTNRFDSVSSHYIGKNVPDLLRSAPNLIEYNILYHNNGDGTFTEVTEKAGVKGNGWGSDVIVFDLDEDGYLDFLVIGMFGGATLYRNNGDGTFTDVTKKFLPCTSWGGMGGQVFDFNNDGKLDLFVVDMHSDMWMTVRYDWAAETVNVIREGEKKKYKTPAGPQANVEWDAFNKERQKDCIFGNALFKNLGNGKFEEISDRANLETLWPWGAAVGDFDNDGYEDIFIPTGMGYPFFYWPNYLMMNNHDETFTNRAEAVGLEPPARGIYAEHKIAGRPASRSSRSAAVADFDGDGRLDLIVNNFNDQPYYFRNHFPQKNYLALRLQGTKSNRDAIGALVKLYAGKEIMTRLVKPASGYLSQSSKTVHFGLGDRSQIDRVEIRWPSGIRQTLENPSINQLHHIIEPKE
jgi:hypothetical protein